MGTKIVLRRPAERPPLPSGQPITEGDLAGMGLSAVDWRSEGDVEGEAEAIIQAERQRVESEVPPLPVQPDTAPPKIPDPVRIEDLPPEQQRELVDALKQTREQMQQAGTTKPGVDKAIDIALSALQEHGKGEEIDQFKTIPKPGNCPHCGWDMAQEDIEPDETDKRLFLVSILGGQRFQKTYKLLDGAASVTFRSLSTRESELIYDQLRRETLQGKVKTQNDYFIAFMRYRLVLSLAEFQTEQKGKVEFPDLSGYEVVEKEPGETQLPAIAEYVFEQAIPTESIQRILGQNLGRFNRLVEKLEARADDPDFWKAIE